MAVAAPPPAPERGVGIVTECERKESASESLRLYAPALTEHALDAVRRNRPLASAATRTGFLDVCGSVLLLEALGHLNDIPAESRSAHVRLLHSVLRSEWFTGSSDSVDVVCAIVHALDALGHRFEHDPLLSWIDDATKDWFDNVDWKEPVATAQVIQAQLLSAIFRCEDANDSVAASRLHTILKWLDDQQDPKLGLWGTHVGAPLRAAAVAASAILPFYAYVQRPLLRTGRMLDTALSAVDSGEFEHPPQSPIELAALVQVLVTCVLAGGSTRPDTLRVLADLHREIVHRLTAAITVTATRGAGENSDSGALWDLWLYGAALARLGSLDPEPGRILEAWRSRRPYLGLSSPPHRLTDHQRVVIDTWMPPLPLSVERFRDRCPPTVTVVIPCFNLGAYLHEAVASVCDQTLQEVELVIVDDGSHDEFTVRSLAALERQGLTIVRQPNRGLACARNSGVSIATGRYVCCLDADDRLRPDFLQQSVKMLDSDSIIGFVNTSMQWFDEADDMILARECQVPDMLVYNRSIVAAVFRKEAWAAVGGYFGGFSSTGIEDWDFWLRLLESGYRAAVIPEVLYDYRVRAGSMSQGMYQPVRWGQLMTELAGRHASVYRKHVTDIIGSITTREAEAREWAMARGRAISWWEGKAAAWQRTATERGRTIDELRVWIDELERAKVWLDAERQRLDAAAKHAEQQIAAQSEQIAALRAAQSK